MSWKLRDLDTGEVLLEHDDPQTFVDEQHRLQSQDWDRRLAIEGCPFELGVARILHPDGSVARGPEKLRRPNVKK